MSEEKEKAIGEISRRDFLRDAVFTVGGVAIGSGTVLSAYGPKESVETKTVSRYICPIDSMEFSTFADLQAHFAAEHPALPAPAVEELIKITVNDLTYELRVEPNWTLVFVLREKLGFLGVKRGCDEGACGVCTVLVDGKPMLSCTMLAIECNGRVIETIESLAPDAVTLHPIQQAFVENFGLQCGYCTPGMIMVTKALLGKNPNPTEQEVRQGLAGNICKCGAYQQIVASVLAAAVKIQGG
jgi:aerobic-type carbon monoxide dehydrogenase small subunit (CoxS/CutS family)